VKATTIAITRRVSPAIAQCELTHLERIPVDYDTALAQHDQYEACLSHLHCEVWSLPAESDLPDSVFVEDAAVVLDDLAVITRPGSAIRQRETTSIADALEPYRRLVHIDPPGTLDGGDVLRIGQALFVGDSSRSNAAGIEQLRRLTAPSGFEVTAVPINGCLHLKSAVSVVASDTILLNPRWVSAGAFGEMSTIDIDPAEPMAANALLVNGTVIYPEEFARTRQRLIERGLIVRTVDASELGKAEGGVTCCSLIFRI